MGGMVALAALIFALDSLVPQGWTPAPLYVAVVGASMWLAGLQPIWIAATACALLTVLAFFVAPPGWINADLFNRSFSILAIWVVALFCVLSGVLHSFRAQGTQGPRSLYWRSKYPAQLGGIEASGSCHNVVVTTD